MRARVEEDDSARAYYWSIEGAMQLWIEFLVGWRLTMWPAQCLGFDSFTMEVEDVLKHHKQQQKVCLPGVILECTKSLTGMCS